MLTNADISQVLRSHVTKYQQRPVEKDWKWTCSCGHDKIFQIREGCVNETNNHLAAKIIELLPDEDSLIVSPIVDTVTGEVYRGLPDRDETPTPPKDLSILSYIIREVDCERLSMPQGRHLLGQWFQGQDPSVMRLTSPARMRRLKQIADAVNEEFMTIYGSLSRS